VHGQEGEYHHITGRFFLHFQDGSGKHTQCLTHNSWIFLPVFMLFQPQDQNMNLLCGRNPEIWYLNFLCLPCVLFLLFLWCKYLKLQRSMVGWRVSDKLERVSKEEILPQWSTVPAFGWSGRWKLRKSSIRMTGDPTEIRTDTSRIQIYH
jgi:hypothetical protein